MKTTNYSNTIIVPAEDCKKVAMVPNNPETVAGLQYTFLVDAAYRLTSDDVLSAVTAQRKDITEDELDVFRADFFSKGQPCFRASPLTKTYGWAVHADADCKIALVDPHSAAFAELTARSDITVVKAMRNKRA